MPGPGAVLIGKLSFVLIPVLLTFAAVVYPTAKKRLSLKNSKVRIIALFFYAWMLSGVVYAVLYIPIHTGFGALPEDLGGTFDVVSAILFSAIAAQFVVSRFGKQRSSRAELILGGVIAIVAAVDCFVLTPQ